MKTYRWHLLVLALLHVQGMAWADTDAAIVSPFRWGGAATPNMANDAVNLPADPGNTPPLWEVPLGRHQYTVPTIDRGRLYLCANDTGVKRPGYEPTGGGVIMRVEQATGKLVWQLPSPRYFDGVKPPYHFDQWDCGICSGPLVEDDRIYLIGNRGDILCLDRQGQANGNQGPFLDELSYMDIAEGPDHTLVPTDGDILWQYNLIQGLDVVLHDVYGSTLLMHGDWLYSTAWACGTARQFSRARTPRRLKAELQTHPLPVLVAVHLHPTSTAAVKSQRI